MGKWKGGTEDMRLCFIIAGGVGRMRGGFHLLLATGYVFVVSDTAWRIRMDHLLVMAQLAITSAGQYLVSQFTS